MQDAVRFLDRCQATDPAFADLIEVLIDTGIRKGEALALHWTDVHLPDRVRYIRHTLSAVDNNRLVLTPPKTRSSKGWVAIPRASPPPCATAWPAVAPHSSGRPTTDTSPTAPTAAPSTPPMSSTTSTTCAASSESPAPSSMICAASPRPSPSLPQGRFEVPVIT
ncbi:hypothetical protein [Kitasatospora sp. DSM 101779]|uniref:hypothetical protein n=1 Tax=Kitasatospora sp. DSM 101779 TaxID=2853165 RepID=UPI0021DA81C3|nr:hypothetical protein [Kitasatospora sp. DSM 101779]MCU7822184.1 hypothetical protein [Kitasatospora sp. DSM 101779]